MIGFRIHRLRKEKGLSLSKLADRAGISKSYLSCIERDKQSNPSIQFLEKITAVLEVDIKQFLEPEIDKSCLDQEWVDLLQGAVASGMSKEEFREFLAFKKWRMNHA